MRGSELIRPEVAALPAYPAASERAGILLDVNESPFGGDGLNRYPDPEHPALREAMAAYYGVSTGMVLATRGSDDAIDALGRTVLRPGLDAVMVTPPTFAMFSVFAQLQGAAVVAVPLGEGFRFDDEAMLAAWKEGVKLVYVCSPNNPTGTVMETDGIARLCARLAGRALVVVDEAYQEFSSRPSATSLLAKYPNLVVLRTLSKAFGLAGIRCGVLLADPGLVAMVRRVLPPYLLPTPVAALALEAMQPWAIASMRERVEELCARRTEFATWLVSRGDVREVVEGEGNFVLARFDDATEILQRLAKAGIRIRAFDGALAQWLRFTIGTAEEMEHAQAALR